MNYIRKDNYYILELDDTINCKNLRIPAIHNKLKVKQLTICNYTSYDFDNLILGNNIEIVDIKNCFASYVKWNKHTRINNLVLNNKLKYIKLDGVCYINNIELKDNDNFELINGYVFQKFDSSIIFKLGSCKEVLTNDKRIKKLSYKVFEYSKDDLFIPENVMEINDRTLYNMFPCNITVHPNNKYFKIINNCLIEINNNSLRKVLKDDVDLSNMDFKRTDGYFFLLGSKEICVPKTCIEMNNFHLPQYLRFQTKTKFRILHCVKFTGNFEMNFQNIEINFNDLDDSILIQNNAEH